MVSIVAMAEGFWWSWRTDPSDEFESLDGRVVQTIHTFIVWALGECGIRIPCNGEEERHVAFREDPSSWLPECKSSGAFLGGFR